MEENISLSNNDQKAMKLMNRHIPKINKTNDSKSKKQHKSSLVLLDDMKFFIDCIDKIVLDDDGSAIFGINNFCCNLSFKRWIKKIFNGNYYSEYYTGSKEFQDFVKNINDNCTNIKIMVDDKRLVSDIIIRIEDNKIVFSLFKSLFS